MCLLRLFCRVSWERTASYLGRHAQQFLDDWQGYLLVDDYGGYKALFAAARAHPETQSSIEPCVELACWTHGHRKFFNLFQANKSPTAQETLQRIAVLHAIETEGQGMSTGERQHLRTEKSRPALADLHDWQQRTRIQRHPTAPPPIPAGHKGHRLQLETLFSAHPLC